MWVWSLGWEDPQEEGKATHSSILAWRTSMDRGAWWTEESMGPWRVKHDWSDLAIIFSWRTYPTPTPGRWSYIVTLFTSKYSWASLVAQLVKNLPAVWEAWVRSLGLGKGYSLQYSGLENSMDCIVHGVQRAGHDWATFTFISLLPPNMCCLHQVQVWAPQSSKYK